MHDMLTGIQPDGTAFAAGEDRTCGNWTKSGAEGAAMVGHHDRMGLKDDAPSKSWNSSHLVSRRLQPGGAARHRRGRAVLLLQGGVSGPRRPQLTSFASNPASVTLIRVFLPRTWVSR